MTNNYLHKTTKIEQHITPLKMGVNLGTSEGSALPGQLWNLTMGFRLSEYKNKNGIKRKVSKSARYLK